MRFPSLCLAVLGCLLGLSAPMTRANDPSAREFFEKRVRPVLVERCFECHGPKSKGRGGLRVDSRAALLRGGDHGPAIVPGKPEQSFLLRVPRHEADVKIPPKEKLPARQIADLAAWVKMGAPWPGDVVTQTPLPDDRPAFTKAQQSFWAFQQPAKT